MNIKPFITILLFCVAMSSASAQTIKTKNAHSKAHEQQLANAKKSQLDKNVLLDLIKNDVDRREEAATSKNQISAELDILANDLLTEARRHIGKRYRSGAKGPSAFDCSGFSSYVFRQFGYTLGASSRDQYNQGEAIDRHSLRKGDLVFFKGSRNAKNVGHVGIVVSANNETGAFTFIHASTSSGIKIDSNTGYYASRYVGARRILQEED